MSQRFTKEDSRDMDELYDSQKDKGVRVEGDYKDGLKDGIWTEWYECKFRDYMDDMKFWRNSPTITPEEISDNEVIKERLKKFSHCTKLVTNYNSGSKEGERTGYSDEEILILKCNYKNDILDGPFTEWWKDGELKLICNYKNGKLDGLYTKFGSGGVIELKCNYKDGIKDGENIIYNPSPIIMSG